MPMDRFGVAHGGSVDAVNSAGLTGMMSTVDNPAETQEMLATAHHAEL